MTDELIVNLLIFILATFLGLELVRHVSRLLHTPLIVMVNPGNDLILALAATAVALAATNIVSGFLIVERIRRMFKRRDNKK
jgi:NAD(P) transhydrogenase subunit alpha